MGGIPDDKVQEVRDRVDIVDLVGRYVDLRRSGRNYSALCPFHQERTPSFNVNPERKGYKCFGCGAGGDAISFVMEIEGHSFPEAVRKLAELYGVHLGEDAREAVGKNLRRENEKDEAYALMTLATELYETVLTDGPQGAAGRAYLQHRGIDPELARIFRLGYAPAPSEAGWDRLAREIEGRSASMELAERLGLIGRSQRTGSAYDRFRGRLMFPVIAPGAEVIAFSGRIVPPHDVEEHDGRPPPKYVNSSESLLFSKSKSLYALATARPAFREKKRAILVEGNIDVVKLHQWGHTETVAPLGTALTPEQARLLARFCDQVIMCFDGDNAGKKAAWSALPHLLEADLDVRMVLLDEGEDPDSVGAERFAALLARAKPALVQMIERIANRAQDALDARARGLDRVVPLIAKVPRESARSLYADRAAELFRLPAGRVASAVRAAMRDAEAPRPAREDSRRFHSISDAPVPLSAPMPSLPPLPAGQAQLCMLLIDMPHLASMAERQGALRSITDPRLSPIASAVVEGARRGEDPNMPALLELVDPAAQRQVHDEVFDGRYREDGGGMEDPQAILLTLLQRCREEALNLEIRELDRQIQTAQDQGYPDKASELSLERLALRRRQAALRQQPATSGDAGSA
jgi:DNA primase